jgi:hypothetical protein
VWSACPHWLTRLRCATVLQRLQTFFLPNGTTFRTPAGGAGKSADKAPHVGRLATEVLQSSGGGADGGALACKIRERFEACAPQPPGCATWPSVLCLYMPICVRAQWASRGSKPMLQVLLRRVDLEQPALEVRFEGLSASSQVPAPAARGYLTVGSAIQQSAEVWTRPLRMSLDFAPASKTRCQNRWCMACGLVWVPSQP